MSSPRHLGRENIGYNLLPVKAKQLVITAGAVIEDFTAIEGNGISSILVPSNKLNMASPKVGGESHRKTPGRPPKAHRSQPSSPCQSLTLQKAQDRQHPSFTPVVTEIQITNMGPRAKETVDPTRLSRGLVKLQGDELGAKSSFIQTLLLGFGYDLTTGAGLATSICGRTMESIIRHKCRRGIIEIKISLRNYPSLEQEFGSFLKLTRKFFNTRLPSKTLIVASSGDPDIGSAIEPYKLKRPELESIYERMGICSIHFRLMVLDEENIKYFIDHQELWYFFVESAVRPQRIAEGGRNLEELNVLIERHRHMESRKRSITDSLKAQISSMSTVDTDDVKLATTEDVQEFERSTVELRAISRERAKLEARRNSYTDELDAKFKHTTLLRMRRVFNLFLHKFDFDGELAFTDCRVACCIWDKTTPSSQEFEVVQVQWDRMLYGRKLIAMMAFFVALWDVSNYLPLFFVDAHTDTEGGFRVPQTALPVLMGVLLRKVSEGRQVFVSLPDTF